MYTDYLFISYRLVMNLRLESMWTLLSRGQLGTTCRLIEEYLRTTWGLLEDYLRTTRKQRGGFLRPTFWSFWNPFEATWCNLGYLVTAFLLSLAQLEPLDEYLMTSSKLLLSEQTYSPIGQQLLFSCPGLLNRWPCHSVSESCFDFSDTSRH